jgi:elongation factor P hydroxylase
MLSFTANSRLPAARDIERVFNAVFARSLNTVLLGGAAEPYYRPADAEDSQHRIFYREDFVASSLHEVSHWLVAGAARRLLPDWGYWYAPDGRNAAQQAEFERAEVKPQALEWLLSIACGIRFRVSLDNLSEHAGIGDEFKSRVYEQACANVLDGVNERTRIFYDALAVEFGGPALSVLYLSRRDLD